MHSKFMLARFIKTTDTFDHLYLGIPARQYHALKQKLLVSKLDMLMTKFDPIVRGVHHPETNPSKWSKPLYVLGYL